MYYNIGLFLYLKLNKTSLDKTSFKNNNISSQVLKKFSCKLYHQILLDLEKHSIIKINNHYCNFKHLTPFTKSFVIHKNILHEIDEQKQKFKFERVQIIIPEKVAKFLNVKDIPSDDIENLPNTKLNRFNGKERQEESSNELSFYDKLEYSVNDLDKICENDEFLFTYTLNRLERLKQSPKFVKGRWYHPFHELTKKMRENVLTFEGEHIKEIFDISASDLHMLAKRLEDEVIPMNELLKFQRYVKEDFRSIFGEKKSGKCTYFVKRAFKIWMNSDKDRYDHFRIDSLPWKIDTWMKEHFPHIRKFVSENNEIWRLTMDEEFNVMSRNVVRRLYNNGIISFTCHDSIYVKKSVNVPNIKQIFYEELNLLCDQIDKMNDL